MKAATIKQLFVSLKEIKKNVRSYINKNQDIKFTAYDDLQNFVIGVL
jgi:hypothetical protein